MFNNLRSKFLFIAVAVLVILVAVLAITSTTRASKNDAPYVGMGDLRRFEAQQAAEDAGTLFADHPYVGMGDLRIFEYMQANGLSADPAHAVP